MKLLLYFTAFLFCCTSAFAQNYSSEWKKVSEYEKVGRVKPAKEQVEKIYALAKKNNNEPQLIKTFFFLSKYSLTLEENSKQLILQKLLEEQQNVSIPTKALLQSIYAENLGVIYNDRKYKIYKMTTLKNATPENIFEWSRDNFITEIKAAYDSSVAQQSILYNTPLSNYNEVINSIYNYTEEKRSLYDFLVERYISLLGNEGSYYNYDEKNSLLYSKTADFLKYTPNDTLSPFNKKIVLLQQLESLYKSKKDTTSLQRAVLRRLEFFRKEHHANLNEVYLKTITDYINTWLKENYYTYRAKLVQAELYYDLANKGSNKDYFIKAVANCNYIIKNCKYNDITTQAENLKHHITLKEIQLTTESYVIPERSILAKVKYRNVKSFKISAYPVYFTDTIKDTPYYRYYKEIIKSRKPVTEQLYTTPTDYGYFEYETEIILPKLKKGVYLLHIQSADNSSEADKYDTFSIIQASNITAISEDTNDYKNLLHILDRSIGKPVKRAKITRKNENFYTDRNGKIALKDTVYGTEETTIIFKGDTLTTRTYVTTSYKYINDDDDDKNDINAETKIFLDRPIYRPGQTVYFKGIVIAETNGIYKTIPNLTVDVEIENDNYDVIKTMSFTTNEFGSFSGEFLIPKNEMPGEFTISVLETSEIGDKDDEYWDNDYFYFDETDISFGVEEYKRPSFEVNFESFKKAVRVNDSVTVSGKAVTYNGAPVTGAKVSYFIKGNNYEYDTYYSKEGETTTDINGNFKISFTATPPKDLETNDNNPSKLNYRVNATITDISGETHECSKTVYAGYQTISLSVNAQSNYFGNTENNLPINITARNNNYGIEPVMCKVKIYNLKNLENRLLRSRPWGTPEIQSIAKNVFIENFPHLSYSSPDGNPDDEELVYSDSLIVKENTPVILNFKDWETGNYMVQVKTKDSLGYIAKNSAKFSFRETKFSDLKVIEYKTTNTNFKEDGYIALELYTPIPKLYVSIRMMYLNEIVYSKIHKVNNGLNTVKLPIDKKGKGQVEISIDYVWENEHKEFSFSKEIAPLKDPFKFITTVIKDKLQPGKEETWSFTIKNDANIPMEVLASMYDTSIDYIANYRSYWNPLKEDHDRIYSYNNMPYKHVNTGGNKSSFKDYKKYYNANFTSEKLNNYGFDISNNSIHYYYNDINYDSIPLGDSDFILKGIVSDELGPIPGVSIFNKTTSISVQTDIDGQFGIPASAGDIIETSFVGFESHITKVADENPLKIGLKESSMRLEGVVVDKYRSVTPVTSAAAMTTVSIEDRTGASLIQSLQGQVAGLSIATGSGQPGSESTIILRGVGNINGNVQPLFIVDGIPVDEDGFRSISTNDIAGYSILKDDAATAIYGNRGANGVIIITTTKGIQEEMNELEKVKTRKNLKETAFFLPNLRTDNEGNLSFSFTSPEALSVWKMRLFAHNKKAESGYFEYTTYTQKDLMIMPNMPRFLREGDEITLIAKVTNTTPIEKIGSAMLELYDATTMQPIEATAFKAEKVQRFSITPKGNSTVSWTIKAPLGIQAIQYKIVAKSGDFSDGEESIIPVLTNRELVTESIPLWVKGEFTKEYTLENLKNNTSSTLVHHGITLEYTSNPTWIALQSLPYLMEFEHECSEQTFSRYYANTIATHIVESNPEIAKVFEEWHKQGKSFNKLEQNEELKSIIMTESPWMLDNLSEQEKKNRIAMLFDLDRVKTESTLTLNKLDEKQLTDGAFPWFEGGEGNEFITRHIIAGFGHLKKMGAIKDTTNNSIYHTIKPSIKYLDSKFEERYKLYRKKDKLTVSSSVLHYLYARSFHREMHPLTPDTKKIIDKYLAIIEKKWLEYSLYEKGLSALVLYRFEREKTANNIVQSLRDTAVLNQEKGMYWKNNTSGWYWYNSPVETQALLIEAFAEIDSTDVESIDAMKAWLIKNKQNKNWSTTKSTADAVYALLSSGTNWLSIENNTDIDFGDKETFTKKLEEAKTEAGTGYIKLRWNKDEVTKNLSTITIKNNNKVPGYGGLYWQYFEDSDKVNQAQEGIMNIKRELYIKTRSSEGNKLEKIAPENPMKIGDLVTIRIVLNIKEDMEYVHLKDVRAAGFEPVNTISGHKNQNGLYYYNTTRDAATHFFFDRIEKGIYVLEYDVRVNNAGEFSNGISTIQSMYAPEFAGHSEGMRVITKP
ncbi:hypothetical protein GCM10007424_09200 [Flavobacterium suaedae]|uniref:Alpha-2-macroglobulin domain-containing protein n=1 Tax=Flavobacterium suaedae TaxID=1767027 RepID=A0ABQ1JKM0_9FLAO|nr:MG2 domain-containing protein [Flavobacterium suaedae]GGB71344.1 hypothetical protein GCM10007424_09200 [Flavobacterium suaedae]